MLAIEMLPGGHGDALVIEWGSAQRRHRMLIDAGTVFSYDDVRARLLDMEDRPYELFVVTHVDEDHIGGAVSLLADRDLRHRINHVWFNGYVHCDQGGNVLGPVDGERLTKLIRDGGYKWNQQFTWPADADVSPAVARAVGGPAVVSGSGDLPRVDLPGGATVHLLSPTGPKLRRMAKVWREVVEANHLVPDAGTDRLPETPAPHEKVVPDLSLTLTEAQLERLARTTTDSSAANGSSIAFILEITRDRKQPYRALLGADAHAPVLARSLRRFAQQIGEFPVRIDLFKLSHHCSKANITAALMAELDVDTFLVSSNGDNFGHPNDEAIACAILGSARPPTFYCNYRTPRTLPWVTRGRSVETKFVVPKQGKAGIRIALR